MHTTKAKAIQTGQLTDKEIADLSDADLLELHHTMKRHADFQEHQVDFKHAMHLVRLLNMGEEILSTGEVHVLRPDAAMLLDIRAGKWTYEEVVEFAEQKDALIRETLYKTTALPKHPDLQFASKLLMEVQDMCWSGQINLRKVSE